MFNYYFCSKNSDYYAGMIFTVHNMYQCLLSFKTQTRNQKNSKSRAVDYYAEAVKLSTLAQEGTFANDNSTSFIKNKIIDVRDFLNCLMAFHSVLPSEESEKEPTKYHIIINYCIRQKKMVTELPSETWVQSYENVYKNFGSSSLKWTAY